jgi:hypothetical protein
VGERGTCFPSTLWESTQSRRDWEAPNIPWFAFSERQNLASSELLSNDSQLPKAFVNHHGIPESSRVPTWLCWPTGGFEGRGPWPVLTTPVSLLEPESYSLKTQKREARVGSVMPAQCREPQLQQGWATFWLVMEPVGAEGSWRQSVPRSGVWRFWIISNKTVTLVKVPALASSKKVLSSQYFVGSWMWDN